MHLSDIETLARALSVRCYLATANAENIPHVVPVHPGWEGSTIWIMTATHSVKARNIANNSQVAMHWETNDAGDGLLVWGEAHVRNDDPTKVRLWDGVFDYDLSAFAQGGPTSPDVVFLEVQPVRAVHALAYGTGGVQRCER